MANENVKPYRPEPMLDFTQQNARKRFKEALKKIRANLGKMNPLFIDGKEADSKQELVSVNPAKPSQVVGRTVLGSQQDAGRAVAAAREAYISWQAVDAQERAKKVLKVAEILRSRREELAALQVFEVSKTWAEADADVCEAIDFCEYYSREMMRLSKPISMDPLQGETNLYSYQPRGVALVIAPWNFPLAISTGMIMASLVAGNTVIYKPSSLSPITGAALASVVHEAMIPPGVFQYFPCSGSEIASWIVDHPDIDLIAFTGSKEVGLDIYQKASALHPGQRKIKRVVAEMGGKNAIIIDTDMDLDSAVEGVVQSAFGFQGQKCSACSRAIVLAEKHDHFKERIVEAVKGLQIGNPADFATQVGAVIDSQAQEKILNYIEIGKSEGKLLCHQEAPIEGYFVGPTVFEGIRLHHRLAHEEIFGPVLVLMKVRNLDEALEVANATEYALTGGFYSCNPTNIERVKQQFYVGNLYINRKITGAIVGRQPFGGFKMSGVGSKAGGPDYLLQFMEPRTVTEKTL